MDKCFDIIRKTRHNFLHLVTNLSIDALNEVPSNFNNTIIWNFGHIIASQQILCYTLSSLPSQIDGEYIARYKKGTKPEGYIDASELETLKSLLFATIDRLAEDLRNGLFKEYTTRRTDFGVKLTNIQDAIQYVSVHDALHLGYAMALRKSVKK